MSLFPQPTITRRFEAWKDIPVVEHLVDNGDDTFNHRWHEQGDSEESCPWCREQERRDRRLLNDPR